MKTQVYRSVGLLVIALILGAPGFAQNSGTSGHWVAVWSTAVQAPRVFPGMPPPLALNNQTIREIIRPTLGGEHLRVRFSNELGNTPLTLGGAHIALVKQDGNIIPGSDRTLTFDGKPTVQIPAGAPMLSDAVDLKIPAFADVAISIYVPKESTPSTFHLLGQRPTYISGPGNFVSAESIPNPRESRSWYWLSDLELWVPKQTAAIVTLGDSITDGFRTTVNANTAWPTLLAKRFSERLQGPRIAVLNAGISGNQVLRDGAGVSALARFDRDVVSEPGVRWVVLLEAINDINIHGQITGAGAVTAADLIAGYQQLIARAHMDHIKIMGATLTPDEGVWLAGPIGEATREKVNQWIRNSGAFDAVIDFDAVVRDPADPKRMLPAFDSGDHIHPNDAGNAAMANAFDLSAFRN